MPYQNGWTWLDDATEEQTESVSNKAAIDRLSNEASSIYQSIPEVRRRGYDDDDSYSAEDARAENEAERITDDWREELTEEQLEQVIQLAFEDLKWQDSEKKQAQFGQIEAIEQLMAARGARFMREYEHWNEDEKLMEYLENRYDHEHGY
jgi:hypothetical protein